MSENPGDLAAKPKTLYQSEGAGCGLQAFQSGLFDQKCGNGGVDDAQHLTHDCWLAGK
jgi:hypothetical protein